MPLSRIDAKALFETGDIPTAADYAALIDQMFDNDQEALTNSEAAVTTVNAAIAAFTPYVANCYGYIKAGGSSWAVQNAVGCAIVLSGTNNSVATITFTTPFTSILYSFVAGHTHTNTNFYKETSRAINVIVIQLPPYSGAAPAASGDTFNFAVLGT